MTCIVCHANWLISGFKIRSTFIGRCHIQSIFRSVFEVPPRNTPFNSFPINNSNGMVLISSPMAGAPTTTHTPQPR